MWYIGTYNLYLKEEVPPGRWYLGQKWRLKWGLVSVAGGGIMWSALCRSWRKYNTTESSRLQWGWRSTHQPVKCCLGLGGQPVAICLEEGLSWYNMSQRSLGHLVHGGVHRHLVERICIPTAWRYSGWGEAITIVYQCLIGDWGPFLEMRREQWSDHRRG